MKVELLNGKQLAAALGRAEHYVTAMKRAGYKLKYEALRKTTLEHALEALERCPDFVARDYLQNGWKALPRCLEPKTKT